MTKPKPRPQRAVDAIREALARESAKRQDELKPIEIVKIAICAFQDHSHATEERGAGDSAKVESSDRIGLRRGTQASVDRLIFNANYWLAAYEDRIVTACSPQDAPYLLKAVTVWGTHTVKLNTMSLEEAQATFERFCPPFATNRRKGSVGGTLSYKTRKDAVGKSRAKAAGKGPVVAFREAAESVTHTDSNESHGIRKVADEMCAEAAAYEELPAASALDAFYSLLPVWCLRDEIPLVAGAWWNDEDVMHLVADELRLRFLKIGYGDAPSQYFHDSLLEAIDAYQRDVSAIASPLSKLPVPQLISLVHDAREARPDFETEGYGRALPAWLAAKEQLVWNAIVCALYGPGSARPLLATSPALPSQQSQVGNMTKADVITDLARASFMRYRTDRVESGVRRDYSSFYDQPADLRNSGIEHVKSIPEKLAVLGYEIVPDGSCYPDQRVNSFTPSEVECLAILEHRRWIHEREMSGWTYAQTRDVQAKTSPYLVPWEDLPDRAREWNRSAIRNIPKLLAAENLAIAKKG